jgi:hypothetical protein
MVMHQHRKNTVQSNHVATSFLWGFNSLSPFMALLRPICSTVILWNSSRSSKLHIAYLSLGFVSSQLSHFFYLLTKSTTASTSSPPSHRIPANNPVRNVNSIARRTSTRNSQQIVGVRQRTSIVDANSLVKVLRGRCLESGFEKRVRRR